MTYLCISKAEVVNGDNVEFNMLPPFTEEIYWIYAIDVHQLFHSSHLSTRSSTILLIISEIPLRIVKHF